MPKRGPKEILLAVISLAAIAGAATAIYFQTRPPGINVPLHRAMGEALAETAASMTNRGKIVLITLDGNKFPILKAQLEGLQTGLAKYPKLELYRTVEVETEGKPKYGPGRGLSEERFLRIAAKYSGRAEIIISLIGSPELDEEQLRRLPTPMPKFIAETRGRDELVGMFAAGVIHAAIVPRFVFPAPVEEPRTPRDWFDTYWQVVNPASFEADENPDKPDKKAKEKPATPSAAPAAVF